jgi:hypothetical protein
VGEPKGFLVLPIGYNPSDDLRSLELDASDNLKVVMGDTSLSALLTELQSKVETSDFVSGALSAMNGNKGWISGAWQKQAFPLGYSDRKFQTVTTTSTVLGTYYAQTTAVPAGELWYVQALAAVHDDAAAHLMILNGYDGATIIQLAINGALAQYTSLQTLSPIVLKPGDTIYAQVTALPLGKSLFLNVWGYRVDIDQ